MGLRSSLHWDWLLKHLFFFHLLGLHTNNDQRFTKNPFICILSNFRFSAREIRKMAREIRKMAITWVWGYGIIAVWKDWKRPCGCVLLHGRWPRDEERLRVNQWSREGWIFHCPIVCTLYMVTSTPRMSTLSGHPKTRPSLHLLFNGLWLLIRIWRRMLMKKDLL